jgi:succinate dehydrogenase/fumarate reductase flavoprotein subunit
MGYVTAKETAKKVKELDWLEIDLEQVKKERERVDALWERKQGIRGFEVKNKIKDIMWRHCALVRDGEGLNQALAQVQKIKAEDLPHLSVPGSSRVFNLGWVEALEAVNMTELAELTIRAALMREESRMAHYRTDFLHQDDVNWLKNIVIRKEDDKPVLTTAPPVITKIKPEMES